MSTSQETIGYPKVDFHRYGRPNVFSTAMNILSPYLQAKMLADGHRNFEVGDANQTGMYFIGDHLSVQEILRQGNKEEDTSGYIEPGNPNNVTYVNSIPRHGTHNPYGPSLLGANQKEWQELYPIIRPALAPEKVGEYIPEIIDAINLLDKDIDRARRSSGESVFKVAKVFKPFAFRGIFSALFKSSATDEDITSLPQFMRRAAFWPTILAFAGRINMLENPIIRHRYLRKKEILNRAASRIIGFRKSNDGQFHLTEVRPIRDNRGGKAGTDLLDNLVNASRPEGITINSKPISPERRRQLLPLVTGYLNDEDVELDVEIRTTLETLKSQADGADNFFTELVTELNGINDPEAYSRDRSNQFAKLVDMAYSKKVRISYETAVATVHHLGAAGFDTTSDVGPEVLRQMIRYRDSENPIHRQAFEMLDAEVNKIKGILRDPVIPDNTKYELYRNYILSKKTVLEAFKKETLRLHPILPYLPLVANKNIRIPYTQKDGTIVEQEIPQGAKIMIALGIIHNDPRHWEKPEEFNPLRHIEYDDEGRIASTDAANKDRLYGVNAFAEMLRERRCPGKEFADMELNAIILHFYMNYDLIGFSKDSVDLKGGTAARPNMRMYVRPKKDGIVIPPTVSNAN